MDYTKKHKQILVINTTNNNGLYIDEKEFQSVFDQIDEDGKTIMINESEKKDKDGKGIREFTMIFKSNIISIAFEESEL